MNAKISVLVICVEAIIYLLLHNLPDLTINFDEDHTLIMNHYSHFLHLTYVL